jgi:hypothetical protein
MRVDDTIPREEYRKKVDALRENMRAALQGRRKYPIQEEEASEEKGDASDESGSQDNES